MPNLFTLPMMDQLAFLGTALIMIGCIFGWRSELVGGITALAGFCLSFGALFLGKGLCLTGFFITLALPGVMYTTSAVLRRRLEKDQLKQI